MEVQDKQENGIPTPEVMTALLDLSRLSHQVESAASETPTINGGATAIATKLLERLLLLCDAQRGAILLQTQRPAEAKHAFVLSPPGRKTFRTFALHGMNEEKAHAIVAPCSTEDAAIQSPPGEPCWVICRLPISVILSGGQVPLAQQQDNRAELSAAGQPGHTFLPLYALLLLGWDGNEKEKDRLRRKLEPDPAHPRYILTKVGIGYLLAAQPEVQAGRDECTVPSNPAWGAGNESTFGTM